MILYLIRHGRTEANEKGLYCGSTDLPLSPAGREAMRGAGYSVPGDCRFLTSGMKRADETMAILFGDVPIETDPDLREVDFGDFEMRSYAELKNDPSYLRWISGENEKNTPPRGESGEAMRRRVIRAVERIREGGKNAVVVTHGGVIAAIMAYLFPAEKKNRYQWQPAPGGGYRLDWGDTPAYTPMTGKTRQAP